MIAIEKLGLTQGMAFAMRFPRLVMIALLAFAIGGALAALGLRANTDTSEMISAKAPYRALDRDLRAAFPYIKDTIVIVLRAPSADEADAAAAALAEKLAPAGTQSAIAGVFAASVDPQLTGNGLLFLEAAELDALLARISQAAPLFSHLRGDPSLEAFFSALAEGRDAKEQGAEAVAQIDRVYRDVAAVISTRLEGQSAPLSWTGLFADPAEERPDFVQRTVQILPKLDYQGLAPGKEALAAIAAAVAELRADPLLGRVEIGVTGDPALRAEELRSVVDGIELSLIISVVSVALLLWLGLRSVGMALIAVSALLISLCITAGFAALVYGVLNLVSVAFVVLVIGLGIDYAIHMVLYAQERAPELGPRAAIEDVGKSLGPALILALLTTIAAFFAFTPTQFVGIAQLGVIAGIGVAVAFVVAALLIPASVALAPGLLQIKAPAGSGRSPIGRAWERSRDVIALLTIGAGLLGAMAAPLARFESDPMALRDPQSPSVQSFFRLFDEKTQAPYRLSVIADGPEAAAAIAARLQALPEVDDVLSLPDFVPADQDAKREVIDFVAWGVLDALEGEPAAPGARSGMELLAETLADPSFGAGARALTTALARAAPQLEKDAAFEQALRSDLLGFWPFQRARLIAQLQPTGLTLESLPVELVNRFQAQDGRWRVEAAPRDDIRDPGARARFVDAVTAVEPRATGPALSVQRAGEIVARSIVLAVAIAFAACAAAVLAILRDWRFSLIILAPLLIAACLTLGSSVVLNAPFNYANVIAIPLLIGLGADGAIHLALRWRETGDVEAALSTSTPRAVLLAALTTIASFGSLALSSHRGTASMGLLLTIALAATLLTTLAVQPWLIRKLAHLFKPHSPAKT